MRKSGKRGVTYAFGCNGSNAAQCAALIAPYADSEDETAGPK